jgi:hypothetical protein
MDNTHRRKYPVPKEKYPHMIIARIWEHLEPLDRGERYEDPLMEALEEKELGEVTGGGTQLGEKGEIRYADIEIMLADLDKAVAFVKTTLEKLGVPEGSELVFDQNSGRASVPIGRQQGVAIYFDGINLPANVYETCSLDDFLEKTEKLLKKCKATLHGCWGGPEETALYFYGPDAETIFSTLEPFLREYPMCQNARVVLRCGNPDLKHKEIRLPMK